MLNRSIHTNRNHSSVAGPLRDERPRTARWRHVENFEHLARHPIPDGVAGRQRGRLPTRGRGHGLRTGAVHPAGHHNGRQTIGGQRDRIDDAVSVYVFINNNFYKYLRKVLAIRTAKTRAGLAYDPIRGTLIYRCVLSQARVERVASVACQGEPPPGQVER